MRQSLFALVALLVFMIPPAVHAQVSETDLAPFVGKYTDAAGGGRFNVYVTDRSGLTASWYFGGGCHVNPYPCDPPNPSVGNLPGGHATAALWRLDGDTLVGDVLSTDQADFFPLGSVRLTKLPNGGIDLRVGDRAWTLDRAR